MSWHEAFLWGALGGSLVYFPLLWAGRAVKRWWNGE